MPSSRLLAYSFGYGLILACFEACPVHGADPKEAFFETRIRPALVEHCLECHGVDTEINGGLALDSPGGWRRGGDTGEAIRPGEPDQSLLIKAIAYDNPDLQMPPEGKLPDRVIKDFRDWIADGAIDPRPEKASAKATNTSLSLERLHDHWAYRPLQAPSIPSSTASTPIDAFIEEGWREKKFEGTPIASRSVLIRRLMLDLHGLLPTPEQVSQFVEDPAEDAYEKLVDSLLASPRFAERQARRWLDVVRYAESLTLRGFIFPHAWRYRDYCIQSFAEDRPFDQVIREQVAGDLMMSEDIHRRQQQLVATTFWMLGNTNLEEQDKKQLEMDLIDEQLDTLGKVFLGQTIGCARCHDHKFDPIPTADYYAMAGVLKSSKALEHSNVSKWTEMPLPLPEDEQGRIAELERQSKSMAKEVAELRKQLNAMGAKTKQIFSSDEFPGVVIDDENAKKIGNWQSSASTPTYVGNGYLHDSDQNKGEKTVTFEPSQLAPGNYEVRLSYSPGPNRASNAKISVFSADGDTHLSIDQTEPPPIEGIFVSLGRFRFEKDGQAFVIVSNENSDGHVIADAVQFLPETEANDTGLGLASNDTSGHGKVEHSVRKKAMESEMKKLEAAKKKLDAELESRPSAMTMLPIDNPSDLPIHIRGDVRNLGRVVPRAPLQLVSVPRLSENRTQPFDRLALAEWLTAPENSLTPRVLANRLWSWMMGEGLVRSVDNFGTTGEAPSHPQLLDYLATQLVQSNWSTRSVIREIVLSDAYRRSSSGRAYEEETDPENRYLWRAQRRRLDAESMRDSILMISGQLELDMFGSRMPKTLKSDYDYRHSSQSRSIYWPVLRNTPIDGFEAFDAADPSSVVGKRNRSTIAAQALWMMNSEWVHEQSRSTAERLLVARRQEGKAIDLSILEEAALLILGRPLLDSEKQPLIRYLTPSGHEATEELTMEQVTVVVQTFFQSLAFRFPE